MKKLYTAEELAKMLQIHPKTVYRLGREGKLRGVRVGRSVRFEMPTERTSMKEESDEKRHDDLSA